MSVNLAQLKAELQADPIGYGYAPLVAARDAGALSAMLNLARDGTNGGAAISIKKTNISANDVLEAIDNRDLPAAGGWQSWFESITQRDNIRLINDDGTDTRVLGNFKRILANAQNSQTRLSALAVRSGSRAEQIFGRDSVVTTDDVSQVVFSL